jgi:hypothetical protein
MTTEAKRGGPVKGRVFKRGRAYYPRFRVAGTERTLRLVDPATPTNVTEERAAWRVAETILAPYKAREMVTLRQKAAEALRTAEDGAVEAERSQGAAWACAGRSRVCSSSTGSARRQDAWLAAFRRSSSCLGCCSIGSRSEAVFHRLAPRLVPIAQFHEPSGGRGWPCADGRDGAHPPLPGPVPGDFRRRRETDLLEWAPWRRWPARRGGAPAGLAGDGTGLSVLSATTRKLDLRGPEGLLRVHSPLCHSTSAGPSP